MQFFTTESHDFEDIAQHLKSLDADFRQLRGGKFQGKLQELQVGPVSCMKVELSHSIMARGRLRKQSVTFSPITPANRESRWRGQTLDVGQVNVLGSQASMDHLASNNYSDITLVVDGGVVQQIAAERMQYDIGESLFKHRVIRPSVHVHQQISRLCETALRAAEKHEHIDEERFLDQVTQILIAMMLAIEPRLEGQATYHTRQQVVRRANELIQENLNRIVTVTELCRAADCSERTLQYAFQEQYGLAPKEYMLIQRLNAVRSEIKRTRPEPWALSRLSKSWGFSHHGEFAARYRHLFGELPRVHAGLYRA